jgi:rhomboid protease GluP
VTIAIVGVNVLVFLAASGPSVRAVGPASAHLLGPPLWLALVANSQLIADGQWYRLITANVLHADWDTLLVNAAGLLVVGWAAESRLGGRVLALVYLLAGTSAVAAGFALEGCGDRFGASAAVYGVLGSLDGYLAARALRSRRVTPTLRYALVVTGLVLASDVLVAPVEVDRLAHFWGLGAGVPLGLAAGAGNRGRLMVAVSAIAILAVTVSLVAWRQATLTCSP